MGDEIRDELQFHIDRQTEENIRAGMSPGEARRAAMRAFGQLNTIEEECREAQRGAALRSIAEDVRFGLRQIVRNRSFAFTVIATVALAVAACATMFSVVDAVLLRPIGLPNPERLLAVYESPRDTVLRSAFAPPNFIDLRQQAHTLQAAAAFRYGTWNLVGQETESIRGMLATEDLFTVLGVTPKHGRPFGRAESDVAVISNALAVRQFGNAAAALNKSLLLDGRAVVVAGVMAPDFRFGDDAELWTPLTFDEDALRERGAHYIRVIARVRSDVPVERSMRELNVIGSRLAAAYPDTNAGVTFFAERWDRTTVVAIRTGLLILIGAVVVLALIAAANIANLLLARAVSRDREWALRTSLGASRTRVIRQVLIESLVFGVIGGVAGLLLTFGGIRAIVSFGPDNIPRLAEAALTLRVALVGVGVAMLMSFLFGILPALSAARGATADLAGGARIAGRRGSARLRTAITIAQLALTVTLLSGAALLVRSFQRVMDIDPGFDPRNVLTFSIALPDAYDSTARVNAFHDALLERLRAMPGVTSAGATSNLPMDGRRFYSSFEVNGVENPTDQCELYVADEQYFKALHMPLLSGRMFDGRERPNGQRVILANATAARRLWPNGNALGSYVKFGASGGFEDYEGQVIGVVGDVRQRGREEDLQPTFYVPLRQAGIGAASFVIRTQAEPATLVRAIESQVAAVDPTVAVAKIGTMDEKLAQSVSRRRFQLFLLAFFASAALLLATLGVYGVVAYAVTQRTREIGVRVAMGATAPRIYRLVLAQALRLAALASIAGILGAITLKRVFASMLFGVSPTDPMTLGAVAVGVIVIALAAASMPALRAALIDPTVALRYD